MTLYLLNVEHHEKVVGNSYSRKIIDSGLLFRPIKFNDLYSLKIVKVYK